MGGTEDNAYEPAGVDTDGSGCGSRDMSCLRRMDSCVTAASPTRKTIGSRFCMSLTDSQLKNANDSRSDQLADHFKANQRLSVSIEHLTRIGGFLSDGVLASPYRPETSMRKASLPAMSHSAILISSRLPRVGPKLSAPGGSISAPLPKIPPAIQIADRNSTRRFRE